MRWFKKWLRFILLVAIIVSIFLFLFFVITENNILNNDFDGQSQHHMPSSASFSSSIHPFHQSLLPFKTVYQFRRNSTGLQLSEWQSSVDFHHLLDIYDFEFIKNGSYLCNSTKADNNSPFLVVLVHSSPKNILKRKVIRKTWGSLRNINGYKIILVFIIGLINSTELQRVIDDESNLNRDIIQATFVDDYQNLTYKHLTSFKWVLRYCNATKFVMKADDDAFIDIFRAVKVLKETFDSSSTVSNARNPRDIIACSLFPDGTLPKRGGKWSVSYNEYPYDTYPSYCSGVAYFLTLDVIYDIYEAAHRIQPVLRIDDVFLTGIVAASLNIHHFPLNLKYEYDDKRLREWLYSSNLKPSSYLVGDIGNVRDWQSLMSKLWIKTVEAWSQYDIIVR